MKKLKSYKKKIELLNKKALALDNECLEIYAKPHYDNIDKLKEIVIDFPESISKFFIYQRIEELKKYEETK